MKNIPDVKLGIAAVSRDCFPMSLSASRCEAVVKACKEIGVDVFKCPTTIESETHMMQALEELKGAGCNALVVYLGNFGPESAETLLAKYFDGPVMFVAAAEETQDNLVGGRGDAYCGVLNASYNLALRNIKAYIPEYPVGTATEVADMIKEFIPVARAVIGLNNLKVISFGPRPQDFLACNAPIKQLYNLGIEIEENSELDLYAAFNEHKNDARIPEVNSRLTARGIPVACEVDIYGAISEYIGACISEDAVTLLDINNSVPADMYVESIKDKYNYTLKDTFMGFHCGNTASCKLTSKTMKYQLIMHRGLEPDKEPDITRGTLEGDIVPGDITFFRLQSTADAKLRAYVAEGEVLPVATRSFGAIGVFAIPEMGRFYRNVLIKKNYPHHGAVAFGHYGKAIFDTLKYLGVEDLEFNRPAGMLYDGENPYAKY